MEGQTPIIFDDFKGHYSRGLSDDIPKDYFKDTLNLQFDTGQFFTRDGFTQSIGLANIVRFFEYKRIGENGRLIILDSSGNLWDSTNLSTPLLTDATWLDFSLINYNNFAYITPHDRNTGISFKTVKVYDGTTIRDAGGLAPSGSALTVVPSATIGHVEVGERLIAVSYETSSGFITPPALFFDLTIGVAGFSIDIGNIPIGPAGTVARRLVATKKIPIYDGNPLNWELFFIPLGRIADNITTSLTVSFFDADLQADASYLNDIFPTLNACLGITEYNGRLVYWGVPGSEHVVYLSNAGSPETIDETSGFILVDIQTIQSGVKCCFHTRTSLYMTKSTGTYFSTDNGSLPATWGNDSVDNSVGGEVFSVSRIYDKFNIATNDKMFVASRDGLFNFVGYYIKPELSYNIRNLWLRINPQYFNLVQVYHDQERYCIYITVPLDSSSTISHIFYAYYGDAIIPAYQVIDGTLVKWSIWQLAVSPSSILVNFDSITQRSTFKHSTVNGIYDFDVNNQSDYGNKITSYAALTLVPDGDEQVNHFAGVRIRCLGLGKLLINLSGEDGSKSLDARPLVLSLAPGKRLERQFNYSNIKCSVLLKTDALNEWMEISKVVLYTSPEFDTLPSID